MRTLKQEWMEGLNWKDGGMEGWKKRFHATFQVLTLQANENGFA